MKVCVERTGGLVVLADTFSQSVFKESLLRVFRRHAQEVPKDGGHLQMAFNASLEVGRLWWAADESINPLCVRVGAWVGVEGGGGLADGLQRLA